MADFSETQNTGKPPVAPGQDSDKDLELIDKLLADYSSKLQCIAQRVSRLQGRYVFVLTIEISLAISCVAFASLVKISGLRHPVPYFLPTSMAVAYVLMVHSTILWIFYPRNSISHGLVAQKLRRSVRPIPRWLRELKVLGDELILLAEQVDHLVRVASETEELGKFGDLRHIELRLRLTEARSVLKYVSEVTGIKYDKTYRPTPTQNFLRLNDTGSTPVTTPTSAAVPSGERGTFSPPASRSSRM